MNWNIVDYWILERLSGYFSDYCLRILIGHNKFLFNLKEDKDNDVKNVVIEPPLYYTLGKESDYKSDLFKKKSKMVFHCMEAHLSVAFLQKIAEEVIEVKISNKTTIDRGRSETYDNNHKEFKKVEEDEDLTKKNKSCNKEEI